MSEHQPVPLTAEALDEAFAQMKQDGFRKTEEAIRVEQAWRALDLDYDAMTQDERDCIALAWGHGTHPRSTLGGSGAAPILVGASHDAACALAYARQRGVAAVVGFVPAVDLEHLRADNVLSLRTSIGTAWGVTWPDPLPAGANPIDGDPGCPVQLWYAPDDPVSTGVEGYAVAIDADLRSVGDLGHTNAAVAAIDSAEVVEFIASSG
jgi:hypothetical protein